MNIQIPTLQTERLRLEPLAMSHSCGVFELWSDPNVCRYSGIVRDYAGEIIPMPAASREDSDRIIDFWIRAAEDGWGFRWAILMSEEGDQTPDKAIEGIGNELAFLVRNGICGFQGKEERK